MKTLIRNLVESARHFTGSDFAVFKICLLSIGILLGSSFNRFFLQYQVIIGVIAITTFVILIVQTIRRYPKKRK